MRPLHVCLYLFPHLHLRPCQLVRKRLKKLPDLILIWKTELIFHTVPGLLHPPKRKDKHKKLFEHEAFSCRGKAVFIFREMHISDRFFVRQKTIFPAQLSGQDIHFVIRAVKRLAHCLYDSIVGQSCSKMIDRLHGVALLFVF